MRWAEWGWGFAGLSQKEDWGMWAEVGLRSRVGEVWGAWEGLTVLTPHPHPTQTLKRAKTEKIFVSS